MADDTPPVLPDSTTPEPESEREVVHARVFDAPARLVFEAWSKPEHIRRWFGPVGWPVTMCEMDFRVGGRWRMAMTGPSGVQNTPFGGTYREIDPPRRLVLDNGFEQQGTERMVWTVTFEEADGRTTLTVRTLFSSVATRDQYLGMGFREGFSSGLDQLGEVLAGLAAH